MQLPLGWESMVQPGVPLVSHKFLDVGDNPKRSPLTT